MAAVRMWEYSPELDNAAAVVDTWTAASASVGEAYAAAASGGSAAWPDTGKRDNQRNERDKEIYSSLRKL